HFFNTATVTGTAAGGTQTTPVSATDTADYSGLTASITLDKEVSLDGTTWFDEGVLLQNPTEFVGQTVYFRAIVTDTGTSGLTGVTLTDLNGPALTLGTSTLTAGQVVTSGVSTISALDGHFFNTATVTGT